jgi:hypothetical protein
LNTHTGNPTKKFGGKNEKRSGTSGLASNPANRQIASSSGASAEQHTKKKFSIYFIFFPKKLEKYDLTRPKMSKYSLTS